MSLVILLETLRMPQSRYGVEPSGWGDLPRDLLRAASLQAQDVPALRRVTVPYRNGAVDLHGALIAAPATERRAQGVTFDAKASRRLGLRLLA